MTTVNRLHRLRWIFLWIFALSIGFVLDALQGGPISRIYGTRPSGEVTAPQSNVERPSADAPASALQPLIDRLTERWMDEHIQKAEGLQVLNNPAILTSLITSVASLIGTLTTSYLLVRKEKRDSLRATLENERITLENAKLRRELETKGSPEEPPL